MMSNGFRNFILLLILLAMVGLPVIWAVQSATSGSASYDTKLKQTVDFYKPQLPIEIDENVTFIDIEKRERDLVYSYEVNVNVIKLQAMESYFTKRDQFDFCNSGNLLEFKTANVRAIARYKSFQEEKFYFKTISSVEGCEYEVKSNNAYSQSISPVEEIDLQNEYLNFFTPIVIDDEFSILKLGRYYTILETKLSGKKIVDDPNSIGKKVLNVACNDEDVGRYEMFLKPIDQQEPVISYTISKEICSAKRIEYKFVFPEQRQIYDHFEK